MTKVDLKAERKDLYAPKAGAFVEVDVPPMSYLMVDGHGDPNTEPAYTEAVEALFAVSYAVKFASKRELERDYVVMPLEGLWWADDHTVFAAGRKSDWDWTMMIRQPDWLPPELWDAAREKTSKKNLAALEAVRLETLAEGTSVQWMHIGPYDDEAPTIARMHDWIAENGYVETGNHHEIYIGDPRRVEPAKLRTVVRQPIAVRAA